MHKLFKCLLTCSFLSLVGCSNNVTPSPTPPTPPGPGPTPRIVGYVQNPYKEVTLYYDNDELLRVSEVRNEYNDMYQIVHEEGEQYGRRRVEDEFILQTSYRLDREFNEDGINVANSNYQVEYEPDGSVYLTWLDTFETIYTSENSGREISRQYRDGVLYASTDDTYSYINTADGGYLQVNYGTDRRYDGDFYKDRHSIGYYDKYGRPTTSESYAIRYDDVGGDEATYLENFTERKYFNEYSNNNTFTRLNRAYNPDSGYLSVNSLKGQEFYDENNRLLEEVYYTYSDEFVTITEGRKNLYEYDELRRPTKQTAYSLVLDKNDEPGDWTLTGSLTNEYLRDTNRTTHRMRTDYDDGYVRSNEVIIEYDEYDRITSNTSITTISEKMSNRRTLSSKSVTTLEYKGEPIPIYR